MYSEVLRVPANDDVKEFTDDRSKRLWWKVDDITDELYDQHWKPTVHNTQMAILTTKQYVPPYLPKGKQ